MCKLKNIFILFNKYPIETLTNCFEGTKNMLDLAVKHNANILFLST